EVDGDRGPQGEEVERGTTAEEPPRDPRAPRDDARGGGADLDGVARLVGTDVGELRLGAAHRAPPGSRVAEAKNDSGSGDAARSSRVYGSCGRRMTSSAVPCSTTRPWLSTRISSLKCRAVARSWVM